jgi:O-antigen/teichoic acid export membrane protein
VSTAIFITVALGYLWIQPNLADIREVLISVIGALTLTVILAILLVQKNYRQTAQETGISLREPIRIGIPLFIIAISGVGINEAYIWIAGANANHVDVAIYGAALRIAKLVEMPLLIINGIIPSTIAQLSAMNDKALLERVLQMSAAIAALPSMVIAVIVFLAPGKVLELVFGMPYSAGWSVLVILTIGQTISVAAGSPGVLMAMVDRQTNLMFIGTCTGIVGIGISLLMAEAHGVVGIAIGAASGRSLHNFVTWLFCLKFLGIKTHAAPNALTNIGYNLKKLKSQTLTRIIP